MFRNTTEVKGRKSDFRKPSLLVLLAVIAVATISGRSTLATKEATGKIPITTASEEARKAFLQGRDLNEKLLIQDSIAHFDKAISLDPNFAWAELSRAQVSPTGKEFFEHLKKAVSLADKASNGEKLLILSAEAGANGNPAKQKEYLDQLIAAYPDDERANFALAGYHFGQQEIPQAIQYYRKATELAPDFSSAWNLLGYAYRQNVDYANSESAFKKYIELIPNDPNPYDSYAELLLKMGKFDESITQYRKSLAIDQNFINAHQGIGMALLYKGNANDAAAEIQKIAGKARSDAETRTALFALTVVDVDSGNWDKALADVDKQYALGEKTNDLPGMTGDLQLKGNILLEMGKYAEAKALFEKALTMTEASNLSQQIKDNTRLFHHYNLARVALGKKDMPTTKREAGAFRTGAAARNNPGQMRQVHQLIGLIALEMKDYEKAVSELQQANQQNPYDLYRLCQAYKGKGDASQAKAFCKRAAEFNSLPNLQYAFIRKKAWKG
ncbi:MAG TPA: tetratricopeptide repeat protein [Pyrinomonadaceae bacterium]|nr:tetratricopeptide repeat protein [Pyrinomonadaceae bacterium]